MMAQWGRATGLGAFGLVVAILLAGFAGQRSTATADPAGDRPPVMVIVLDEIPTAALIRKDGGIWKSRFPNLARLSREAAWYPNHTTVASQTFAAVPAILTGRYPPPGDIAPVFTNYGSNLFTLMHAAGYRVDSEETATQICPEAICPRPAGEWLDPAGFATTPSFVSAKVAQHWDRARAAALAGLRSVRIEPGKLIFRHFLLPHQPYQFLPSGQRYPAGPIGMRPPTVAVPKGNARLGYERMMLQTGHVDRIIGALRRNAIRQGVWNSMILVVVGDHGVEHRPDLARRTLNAGTLGSIGFTPLFVKYPGNAAAGMSRLATQGVDVLPTIAQEAGIEAPHGDGTPIRNLTAESRPVRVGSGSFPFSQAVSSRDDAVRFRDRLLGPGRLFRMKPAAGLIGRRPDLRRLRPIRAKLDQPQLYRSVRIRGARVPAMVTGTVRGNRRNRILAVSVNGVIRGTAQVFRDGSRLRFGAMIDPRKYRRQNRLAVYLVRSRAGM